MGHVSKTFEDDRDDIFVMFYVFARSVYRLKQKGEGKSNLTRTEIIFEAREHREA